MTDIVNISRRDFLKSTGASSAVVLGAQLVPHSLLSAVQAATGAASVQPNLFVSIDAEGLVTLTCSRSEMGQGARTGIPMICSASSGIPSSSVEPPVITTPEANKSMNPVSVSKW